MGMMASLRRKHSSGHDGFLHRRHRHGHDISYTGDIVMVMISLTQEA